MAVRIRVYPQYGGMGGMGMGGMGMGGMGGAVSASTYYNSKLQTQRQVSQLQLGYERALWGERLDKVRLEERLKNPYMGAQGGYAGAFGGLPLGLPMGGMPMGIPMGGMGGLPMGGVPGGFGGFGGFGGGSGQTNITNQTSTGGNQSVSNVNTSNHSVLAQPPGFGGGWGSPFGFGGGGGGFLSGLLGALI